MTDIGIKCITKPTGIGKSYKDLNLMYMKIEVYGCLNFWRDWYHENKNYKRIKLEVAI